MIDKKKEILDNLILEYMQSGLMLALSGGVDSTLLLAIMAKLKNKSLRGQILNIMSITFQSPLNPIEEINIARDLSAKFQIPHELLYITENFPDKLLNNNKDRCYACKKHLFQNAINFAKTKGISILIDGTNSDDLNVYRPGKKALDELGVKSPLAIAGFTKNEIKQYARELKLPTFNRPSMPCLATRFPYNTKLDFDILQKIHKGESFLRSIGFEIIRLRFHDPILRIEIKPELFIKFIKNKDKILIALKKLDFKYITLDIEGFRSGSFDK